MIGYKKDGRKRKGQSAMEYSMLFIVIAGALLIMQNYMKRGFQGRWKSAVDGLGEQYDPQFSYGTIRSTVLTNSKTVIETVPINAGQQQISERYDYVNSYEVTDGLMSIGAY